MILSNAEIVRCIDAGKISIDPIAGRNPQEKPFNTSAVDLRLGNEIVVPNGNAPFQLDLRNGGIAQFWQNHSKQLIITEEQPYSLSPGKFILARTKEKVGFPFLEGEISYSARVEGRSSLARCGVLVHFTAPTIHAGFEGTITLEIINLGPASFLLSPDMYICQLIIEEVKGSLLDAPNQFFGQTTPVGNLK